MPERDLSSADPDERRKAILDEIETTVLPRTLTFKIGAAAVLVLDAAEQRLHRVLSVDGVALDDQLSSVIGVPLGGGNVQLHSTVGALIALFSQHEGSLTVLSAPELDDHDPNCEGVAPGDFAVKGASSTPPTATPKKPVKAAAKQPAAKAATGKASPAKPKASPAKPRKAPVAKAPEQETGDSAELFDAVADICVIAHLVNRDGTVIKSGGTDPRATLLGAIGDVASDTRTWMSAVQGSVGNETMLIARSKDLDGLGLCLMADGDRVIVAAFANKQFARLISFRRGAA